MSYDLLVDFCNHCDNMFFKKESYKERGNYCSEKCAVAESL